ncbi:hypothetical protein BF49_5619 [Bradyrhizobium sp.]|nr:hypothetical protein BF49_5619 [Bradyrhizobium sp.]
MRVWNSRSSRSVWTAIERRRSARPMRLVLHPKFFAAPVMLQPAAM